MSFAQHLKNILRFNLYLFIITLRHNNKIQEQGESQIRLSKSQLFENQNLRFKTFKIRDLRLYYSTAQLLSQINPFSSDICFSKMLSNFLIKHSIIVCIYEIVLHETLEKSN